MIFAEDAGFKSWRRKAAVNALVVHESVCVSRERTIRVLRNAGFGVHFLVDVDGMVYATADPARKVAHAGGILNDRSIGIEVVNPYYGAKAKAGDLVIQTHWAHRGPYIVPPLVQLEGCYEAVGHCLGLGVPEQWVGVDRDKDGNPRIWMRTVEGADVAPGIHAHGYTAHADGWFPVLYCWLRHVGGWPPDLARAEAIALADHAGKTILLPGPYRPAEPETIEDEPAADPPAEKY